MKIGFTADIHIKLNQKNIPVEWAKKRYHTLWDQIKDHNKNVDCWIIGGDIFDRAPTIEEVAVFFEFLDCLEKPTFIYDGNHEATKKGETFLTSFKRAVNNYNSNVHIIDDYYSDNIIDIIPYCKLKEFASGNHPEFKNKICCSHVRGEIPPHVKPEINLELFDKWEVVLCGDLHSYDNCQRNILYPGSPVTTSFHRSVVDTGFIILDSDTLDHEWVKLSLPQLIRKTIQAGEPMPATPYHHTIYEVEGDLSKLSSVEDNALIDKKIVKRETDVSLILDSKMTLEEEVSEYLQYILALDDPTRESVIKELQNHAEKLNSI